MRIISGSARGKRLAGFQGRDIRPTPDRVREAIFSLLLSRCGSLAGRRILDLYAGTGAMGIEALSRGAAYTLFVDQGSQSCKLVPANLHACGFDRLGSFRRSDVFRALDRLAGEPPFDLIFLDPPYGKDLVEKTIAQLDRQRVLAEGGLICAESERQSGTPEFIGSLIRVDHRVYGSTAVHLFARPDLTLSQESR